MAWVAKDYIGEWIFNCKPDMWAGDCVEHNYWLPQDRNGDNSHLEIVNPSTTEPICALILMGIFKSMGDFAEEWNKEHRK